MSLQDIVDLDEGHRKSLVAEAIQFCTSAYSFREGITTELSAALKNSTELTLKADISKYWHGILSERDFLEFLKETNKDPSDIHAEITDCQEDYLDDRLFSQNGPNRVGRGYSYNYQFGYDYQW